MRAATRRCHLSRRTLVQESVCCTACTALFESASLGALADVGSWREFVAASFSREFKLKRLLIKGLCIDSLQSITKVEGLSKSSQRVLARDCASRDEGTRRFGGKDGSAGVLLGSHERGGLRGAVNSSAL